MSWGRPAALVLASLAVLGPGITYGQASGPPLISRASCPSGALPLGARSVARAADAALRAERAADRPFVLGAAVASAGGVRNGMVRHFCGSRVWRRTVCVSIDLRRYHPSASLSERVSFVARTRRGYVVYALGH